MHPSPRGTFDRRIDLRAKGAQPQVLEFKAPIFTDAFASMASVVDDVVFNFSIVCQCLARQLKEPSPN
jgi:hypothetical protein